VVVASAKRVEPQAGDVTYSIEVTFHKPKEGCSSSQSSASHFVLVCFPLCLTAAFQQLDGGLDTVAVGGVFTHAKGGHVKKLTAGKAKANFEAMFSKEKHHKAKDHGKQLSSSPRP
jgi:hypothetical protein